jgi:integrase
VSLGSAKTANLTDDPDFVERWIKACRQYDKNVARAERQHSGEFDALTLELIEYLARSWETADLAMDDEVRWTERSSARKKTARDNLRSSIAADLQEALNLRGLGDIEEIVVQWRGAALEHTAEMGLAVDQSDPLFISYVRAIHEAQIGCWQAILKRLEGEFVPTPSEPVSPIEAAAKVIRVPLTSTFDAYAVAQGISEGVKLEWRRYVQHLVGFLGHDDAARLTREEVVSWRDHLLETPTKLGKVRKPITVKDKYLTALRCTLGWAVEEHKLSSNVASEVAVRVPKEAKSRAHSDFTMDEAARILRASLVPASGRLSAPYVRARRWIPWLCAYSGARVNELSQLRKEDVQQIDGIWLINITPDAGSVKNRQARQVPLHAHIIEQGFLEVVKALPEGPIFYDPAQQRVDGEGNRHFKKVGERLAKWVREDVGIEDPALKPNHAWRHLFKTLAAEAGIQEKDADALQGHAPNSTARNYGQVNLRTRAAAIAKFPRFELQGVSDSPA